MVVWLTMGSRKTHHREHEKSRRSEEEEGEKPRPSRKSLLEERKAAAAGAKAEERERGGGRDGRAVAVKRQKSPPLPRGWRRRRGPLFDQSGLQRTMARNPTQVLMRRESSK